MEENDVKAHQIKVTHAQHLKRIQKNHLGLIEPHVESSNALVENGYAMVPLMPAEQNQQNAISNQMTSQHEKDIFSNDYDGNFIVKMSILLQNNELIQSHFFNRVECFRRRYSA